MKRSFFLTAAILFSLLASAQFEVADTVITFYDETRDRDIETELYFPQGEENQTIAEGVFPVIAIGHGFGMSVDAYLYLWEHLVPDGYIVALPTTESSIFSVSHQDFALDLLFVVSSVKEAGEDPESVFYQHVDSTSAVSGHSMGGGAAMLAAAENQNITTVFTLAAAETSPSAIDAANNVDIPSLTLSGDEDCVTPAEGNQLDMYQSLSDCKAFATLYGGSHCQFANSNAFCELGEVGCNTGAFMDEALQHEVVLMLVTPWLNAWLKKDMDEWENFQELHGQNTDFELDSQCSMNPPFPTNNRSVDMKGEISVEHRREADVLYLHGNIGAFTHFYIYNMQGRLVKSKRLNTNQIPLDNISSGHFILVLSGGQNQVSFRIII